MPEISQEDFDLFETYKQLGEPQHIVDAIAERNSIKRQGAVAIAAQLNSFKPNVLDKLAKDLEIIVKDDKAYVMEGEAEVELADYAEQNWGDFLPSLKADAEKEKGVTYIAQSATGKSTGSKSTKKSATNYVMQKYGWVLGNDSV